MISALRRPAQALAAAYKHHREPVPGHYETAGYALVQLTFDALCRWPWLYRKITGRRMQRPVPGRWYPTPPDAKDPDGARVIAERWQ